MTAGALNVRLALVILSRDSDVARNRRCFQRTAILSLAMPQTNPSSKNAYAGWLRVKSGDDAGGNSGSLLLRYVVSSPPSYNSKVTRNAALLQEQQYHGDIWTPQLLDVPSTCFSKVVYAYSRLSSEAVEGAIPDFVAIGDDDAWLHPPRLFQDLMPLAAMQQQQQQPDRHIMYGYVNFNVGWIRKVSREYGFGQGGPDAYRMWRQWYRRRDSSDGPFPNAFGFCMIVSTAIALHVSRSTAVAAYLASLAASPRPPLPWGLRHKPNMCDPPTDASLGWVLTHLDPLPNITVIDHTYGARVSLEMSNISTRVEVLRRTAVIHHATSWSRHFRTALCTSTRPKPGPRTNCGGRGEPQAALCDQASKMRCRGVHAPNGACGAMGCTGPRSLIYKGSRCEAHEPCARYYNATFANWTFCIFVGNRRTPRLAQQPGRPWRVCEANATEVLEACASGRTAALLPVDG